MKLILTSSELTELRVSLYYRNYFSLYTTRTRAWRSLNRKVKALIEAEVELEDRGCITSQSHLKPKPKPGRKVE